MVASTAFGAPTTPVDPQPAACAPFLGLDPPGITPEPFAPELASVAGSVLHGAVAVGADGERICWSVLPPAVLCVHCVNGVWVGPRLLPLPGSGVQAPAFSPDGRRLYFQAKAPDGLGSLDIWWVDAEYEQWTAAVNLGAPVNGPGFDGQPTVTCDGEVFFAASMDGVGYGRGIFHARPKGAGFTRPEPVGGSINTPGIDTYPFISPDGDVLLFASNRGRSGEDLHIHVAFRSPDGSWTDPVDLHPLMNHPDPARFPSLSPDGRWLFFWSEGLFWWVDAAVIPTRGSR